MILDILAEAALQRVKCSQACISSEAMERRARAIGVTGGFPFETALSRPGINFICEIKKASPSQGVIDTQYDYVAIAREYEQAGAAAISVLTEPDFFQGRDSHLQEISQVVALPLLRKDFTVDAYQLYEAKVIGASAVLLICALLDTATIRNYIKICDELGLSALVEAHDAAEIGRALDAGARIIGVNNRDLKDFTVYLNNSVELRPLVPDGVIFVAESGIKTAADIEVLRQKRVNAVLIGEVLMRSPDKAQMLAELKGERS
ncbi:MAG: indole-3-glycerol phosphate synthase TrpC [Syntrophomonadaceae bacterium]|nr:indole-3-glycerol phosphate synthase TrpC [Syntrophomonadaceae bacterium]